MEFIEIVGARENNLKNISLTIPKRQITVFTGVSGSGKSSIVFDTIAAEAQRQLNETFTAFARNFLPSYGHADLDSIENISAAIVVDQKRLTGGARSTVGTITDIAPLLRLLFSRAAQPYVGYANSFSFNDPQGMCPGCDGLGRVTTVNLDAFIDSTKSLNGGALLHPDFKIDSWYHKLYTISGFFDNDKPLQDYTPDEWQALLHGTGAKIPLEWQGGTITTKYEGLVEKFKRLYISKDVTEMSDRNRETMARFTHSVTCPACHGDRLNEKALNATLGGRNIAQVAAMEATEIVAYLRSLDGVPKPLLDSLLDRMGNLVTIGLGYLSLDRATSTLSGGESQRVKMVRHLSSSLIDMMYIFDEPSVGLHPRDVRRLKTLLVKLRDKGNTVLLVEHDRDVIEVADHVVDVGPKAGHHGGEIVYTGDVEGLAKADTLTGRFMRHALEMKSSFRSPTGSMPVRGAAVHNLKGVDVDIPTGVLTVVTGVAGSGKSTLINEVFLTSHPDAVVIDQAAVAANRRSNLTTYTGILDPIRKLFAKAAGVSPSLFSANSAGACPDCQGLGVIYTDLAFMDGVKATCETCDGRRFKEDVLRHRLRGRNISEVLTMTAAEAAAFFPEKKINAVLTAVNDVGLDYLTLGQPLSTLSGGECQRVKLATELHKDGTVYIMDEPTTGLHMSDVAHLLAVMNRLVDQGNSVIAIEHNLDVVRNADWIIDMGPEGGSAGGQVIFQGTPADLLTSKESYTAEFLRADLNVAGA